MAMAAIAYVAVSLLRYRATQQVETQRPFVDPERDLAFSQLAGELLMSHDATGRVLYIGEGAPCLFDTDPRKYLGDGLFNRIHVADRPLFFHAVNSAARGSGEAAATVRVRSDLTARSESGNEEPRFDWAEMRFRGLRPVASSGPAGKIAAAISVTRNVTEAKAQEQRLEAARADAVLAVSLKDRLLANVSHELRTPLNAILGFSEMLGNKDLSPADPTKRFEYARIIHSSAEHLLSVVNLVLDMSKIEAGKFEIVAEPFELGTLIKDCCDMLSLRADAAKITLIREQLNGIDEIVADKRACRQILLNLMSNAVKFTLENGAVTVGANTVGHMIHIHVTDTGIGIPADHLPRLGDPFYQVRSSYDRSHEGAGLGLSLVRGLVGLHGGSLLLESVPGRGTRVTVRLPIDCRTATRAGVGAPRLETSASLSEVKSPLSAPRTDSNVARLAEERKIA